MRLKHERFIDEYINTGNGAEAARKAGYCERTARISACRLLTQDNIKKVIEEKRRAIAEQSTLTAEQVVQKLADIANTADKASDRVAALRLLGLNHGLFKESTQALVGVFTQMNTGQEVKQKE
jgi:phage terminase small subunit